MDIQEIFNLDLDNQIKELKNGRNKTQPNIEKILKELDPKEHKVFDRTLRKDKVVKTSNGETRIEHVARVGIAMQKLIIKRSASFLFGNPVKLTTDKQSQNQEMIFNAIIDIFILVLYGNNCGCLFVEISFIIGLD